MNVCTTTCGFPLPTVATCVVSTACQKGLPFFPTDRVLSQDEIVQLITNFAQLGVHKVRITGGEPLLRTDVVDIVRRIKEIDGIEDVSITTNGLFLAKKAKALKEAGLDRLNISLDTFKPEVYKGNYPGRKH